MSEFTNLVRICASDNYLPLGNQWINTDKWMDSFINGWIVL